MSRKTQRYSKEFKAEAVRTVLENLNRPGNPGD
ncbi:IS600 transposase [Escherichia coli O145:H28]|nr:IS600 transposase [Escherichia coli O145:H28]GEH13083.1 IS600 transposase [Escherichia coli O145:H28]